MAIVLTYNWVCTADFSASCCKENEQQSGRNSNSCTVCVAGRCHQ